MGRRELDHLAGADEQDLGLAQVFEQLRRQPHRGRRHADRVAADLGRRCAPPSRPRTSAGTSAAASLPSVPALSASRTACFSWPRICGSPSTIESSPLATRNAWRAADGALEHVGVRAQRLRSARRRRRPASRPPGSTSVRVGADVELGAVAGRDDRDLARPARRRERNACRVGAQLLRREREPAAQIERRGRVVEPQREDAHRPIIKFAPVDARAAQGSASHRLDPSTPSGTSLNFFAPAVGHRRPRRRRWPSCSGAASSARLGWVRLWRLGERGGGGGRLLAGLVVFGHDGRMATYAAMVVACALGAVVGRAFASAARSGAVGRHVSRVDSARRAASARAPR